jgi:hypothetical protein
MTLRTRIPALAMVLSCLLTGCFQQIAVNSLGGIMDDGFTVINEEQDLEIADKSIASNLKLLETILRSDPENAHYLFLASVGYSSYALGFVEDTSPERARVLYLRAKAFGMRALGGRQALREGWDGPMEVFTRALATCSHDDVPALFWTAVGWGSYISLNLTDPSALADLQKVEAMMSFVLQHDSTYYNGGAHFFLGTLAGSRPALLGGSPERSRQHFEACLAINGGKFLMTYIYYARSYAVQTQNRELFLDCLAKVDTASIDLSPEIRLSNSVAKMKARLLRGKVDELF